MSINACHTSSVTLVFTVDCVFWAATDPGVRVYTLGPLLCCWPALKSCVCALVCTVLRWQLCFRVWEERANSRCEPVVIRIDREIPSIQDYFLGLSERKFIDCGKHGCAPADSDCSETPCIAYCTERRQHQRELYRHDIHGINITTRVVEACLSTVYIALQDMVLGKMFVLVLLCHFSEWIAYIELSITV